MRKQNKLEAYYFYFGHCYLVWVQVSDNKARRMDVIEGL